MEQTALRTVSPTTFDAIFSKLETLQSEDNEALRALATRCDTEANVMTTVQAEVVASLQERDLITEGGAVSPNVKSVLLASIGDLTAALAQQGLITIQKPVTQLAAASDAVGDEAKSPVRVKYMGSKTDVLPSAPPKDTPLDRTMSLTLE